MSIARRRAALDALKRPRAPGPLFFEPEEEGAADLGVDKVAVVEIK